MDYWVESRGDRIYVVITAPRKIEVEFRLIRMADGTPAYGFTYATLDPELQAATSVSFVQGLSGEKLAAFVLGLADRAVELAAELSAPVLAAEGGSFLMTESGVPLRSESKS